MDGVHDLGGVEGFGPVRHDGDGAVAAEPWELRAHALALIAAGESLRPWIERLPPATYLSTPYFARWLLAIENLLVERGSVRRDELDRWYDALAAGVRTVPTAQSPELTRSVSALMTSEQLLPASARARFVTGDPVRVVRRRRTAGVSRCPRYVRGAVGTVERICGAEHPLDRPGSDAVETVYTVAFASTDLWGAGDEPPFTVHVDLIEHDLTEHDLSEQHPTGAGHG